MQTFHMYILLNLKTSYGNFGMAVACYATESNFSDCIVIFHNRCEIKRNGQNPTRFDVPAKVR